MAARSGLSVAGRPRFVSLAQSGKLLQPLDSHSSSCQVEILQFEKPAQDRHGSIVDRLDYRIGRGSSVACNP